MNDSMYVLQQVDELKRRVQDLEAQVRLLTDLVQERVGVGIAPAAAPGDLVDVVLVSYPGNQKISVIKILRELTGLGLAEAKAMSETLPATVIRRADPQRAEQALRALGDVNAAVERRPAR